MRKRVIIFAAVLLPGAAACSGDCTSDIFQSWTLQNCPNSGACLATLDLIGGQYDAPTTLNVTADGCNCQLPATIGSTGNGQGNAQTGEGTLMDCAGTASQAEAICTGLSNQSWTWIINCNQLQFIGQSGTAIYVLGG